MRKWYFILLLLLAFSCSKDSILENGQEPDLMLKSAAINPSATVIEVAPGSDDTQSLINAFTEATAAGKGSVVKLLPGTYTIRMIEIKEFNGLVTGSGENITVITNLADIPVPDDVINNQKLPALIKFVGGDVTVSDLSVRLTLMPWLGSKEFNLLQFSDYSIDYMPSDQHIAVRLENLELSGIRMPASPNRPFPVNGVKCAPDLKKNVAGEYPRSNIDLTVSDCSISVLNSGIYFWGCKSGKIRIGTDGSNTFIGNMRSLSINENLGLHVKIWNNEFTQIPRHSNVLDLNTGESAIGLVNSLEVINLDAGTYEVRNNTFNITGPGSSALGLMDTWRVAYPLYPTWMKIIFEDNTFVLNNQGAWLGSTYCMKNMLFVKNTVTGNDVPYSWLMNTNLYWLTDLQNNASEGCRFINNHFLRKNCVFYMDVNVNEYLLEGDFANVTIQDFGENNRVNDKTNPNHANGTNDIAIKALIEGDQSMIWKLPDE